MFKSFATLGVALLIATAGQAQAPQRTFVAGTGNDANTCLLDAPCRTIDRAISVVADGGEIVTLTSNGYGPFTASKSVTVVSPIGVHAAITALTGQDAIHVNAGNSGVVILRGLALTGLGGTDGIKVFSVGDLHIENCVVSKFLFKGIHFPFIHGRLYVTDSTIRDNGAEGALIIGVDVTNRASAVIEHCIFERNTINGNYGGIDTREFADVIIRNSVIARHYQNIKAQPNFAGLDLHVWIENSMIAFGTYGIYADGSLTSVGVSNTTIMHSSASGLMIVNSAVIGTRGNNTLANNFADGAFNATLPAQ